MMDPLDRIIAAYRRTSGMTFGRFLVFSVFPWSLLFASNEYLAAACDKYAMRKNGGKPPW